MRWPLDAKPLSFIRIERDWQSGDTVEVKLPMAVSVRTWAKNKDSVSVDYGPLTFSLKIGERWSKFRERVAEVAGVRALSHDAVELRPGTGRRHSGRLVRAGPRRGPAARPAVHARDRTA